MFEESSISAGADVSKDKSHMQLHRKLSKEEKRYLFEQRPDLDLRGRRRDSEEGASRSGSVEERVSPRGNRLRTRSSRCLNEILYQLVADESEGPSSNLFTPLLMCAEQLPEEGDTNTLQASIMGDGDEQKDAATECEDGEIENPEGIDDEGDYCSSSDDEVFDDEDFHLQLPADGLCS